MATHECEGLGTRGWGLGIRGRARPGDKELLLGGRERAGETRRQGDEVPVGTPLITAASGEAGGEEGEGCENQRGGLGRGGGRDGVGAGVTEDGGETEACSAEARGGAVEA